MPCNSLLIYCLKMNGVHVRNVTNRYFIIKWLSFTILRNINDTIKDTYRKTETNLRKVTKIKCDLEFNYTCLKNDLLPNYTNIRLHDNAARTDDRTLQFRASLVTRQIDILKEELVNQRKLLSKTLIQLRRLVSSDLRFEALMFFLLRINNSVESSFRMKHLKELQKL